jgi:hypothetical protein
LFQDAAPPLLVLRLAWEKAPVTVNLRTGELDTLKE